MYQGAATTALQGHFCHLNCILASAFNRSSVLVKTKRWAVGFILETHLCLGRFELEGYS